MSELSQPLSRRGARRSGAGPRRHIPVARLAAAAVVLLLGAAILRVVLVDAPFGGRPVTEVEIASSANPVVGANVRGTTGSDSIITIGPELAPEELAAEIDAMGGTGAATEAASEPVAGNVVSLPDVFGALPELIEESEYGPLPRTAADGRTPFVAYSRPAPPPSGQPRIAILVSGLGINMSGTLAAIASLPETVSFGFAPYGRSLERTVGTARAEGHEVFLEVPLEPFDYPENDPGPDTLLTGQAPRDNIVRLNRVMARFSGYAGVINNMGARFTASAADFAPMMEELSARGLGYLDDGSSNRSLGVQLAGVNRVPFARVDVTLDETPTQAAIGAKLDALEAHAREYGQALGLATALPVTVDAIAAWAREAAGRGIVLVPVSALMAR